MIEKLGLGCPKPSFLVFPRFSSLFQNAEEPVGVEFSSITAASSKAIRLAANRRISPIRNTCRSGSNGRNHSAGTAARCGSPRSPGLGGTFPNRSGMPSPSRRRGTEIRFISIKPTSCKKRSTTSSRSASDASRPRNFSPRFQLSICSSTVGSTRCRSPSNSTRPSPAAPPPRGSRGKGAKIRD